MARSLTVLGALGSGSFAPLLARDRWDGGERLVVLARPAPDAASAVSGCGSDRVVAEEGRVVVDGRAYGIARFVPGLDADQLVAAHPLAPDAIDRLADGVRAALSAAPVPHGALTGAAIRVTPDGEVRVLGFRGQGRPDLDALDELIAAWREECAGGTELLDGHPAQAPPTLVAHPLAGRGILDVPPGPGVPPKARTAAFAAVTLILGLLAGWVLARP